MNTVEFFLCCFNELPRFDLWKGKEDCHFLALQLCNNSHDSILGPLKSETDKEFRPFGSES
ncbi:hypothetical protein EBQ90_02115 [bacterium]|nr:hypothetical protein [bacterium]